MAHTKQQPDQRIDWREAYQLEFIAELSGSHLVSAPHSPRRKRDLWGRLKSILVGRLRANHGLSEQEAQIQAEKWLNLSVEPEAIPQPRRNKVIPIR